MTAPTLSIDLKNARTLIDALVSTSALEADQYERLKHKLKFDLTPPQLLYPELRSEYGVREETLADATLQVFSLTGARFDLEPTLRRVAEEIKILSPGAMNGEELIIYGKSGELALVACSNPLDVPPALHNKARFELAYASPRMIRGQYQKLVEPQGQAPPPLLELGARDSEMLELLLTANLTDNTQLSALPDPLPGAEQTRLEQRLIKSGLLAEQAFMTHFAKLLGSESREYLPGEVKARPSAIGEFQARAWRAVAIDDEAEDIYLSDPLSIAEVRAHYPRARVTLIRERYLESALAIYEIPPSARGGTLAESYLALGYYSHKELKAYFKPGAEDALSAALKPDSAKAARAMAHFTGKAYLEPDPSEVDRDIHSLVPWGRLAFLEMGLMPWRVDNGKIDVLMLDPRNRKNLEKLRSFRGITDIGEIAVTSFEHLEKMVSAAHDQQGADKLVESLRGQETRAFDTPGDSSDEGAQYIDALFREAVSIGASDIHIEPQRDQLLIRFRVNRVLRSRAPIRQMHFESAAKLVNRVKILANLNISEKRNPQDGRLTYKAHPGDRGTDMRVSVLPTAHGEKVVIRLLTSGKIRSLDSLGFTTEAGVRLRSALSNTEGIVLVCGPTGSGKTNTGYSTLMHLTSPEINMVSIEDPIEQQLDGVNQTQVNVPAGLTFARALRALMRQDPDIIFVGEIRDSETALIAFEAALTGHLVIGTVHASNAAATMMRLENLGVPRHQIANSLKGVVAQRLIPRVCETCGVTVPFAEELAAIQRYPEVFHREILLRYKYEITRGQQMGSIGSKKTLKGGCKACSHSGIGGRVPIFETLLVDEKISEHIGHPTSDTLSLRRLIRSRNVYSMRDDAVRRYLAGSIDLDNLLTTPGDDSFGDVTLEET